MKLLKFLKYPISLKSLLYLFNFSKFARHNDENILIESLKMMFRTFSSKAFE